MANTRCLDLNRTGFASWEIKIFSARALSFRPKCFGFELLGAWDEPWDLYYLNLSKSHPWMQNPKPRFSILCILHYFAVVPPCFHQIFSMVQFAILFLQCLLCIIFVCHSWYGPIWLQSQHWDGRHISRHHQSSQRRLVGPKNSQYKFMLVMLIQEDASGLEMLESLEATFSQHTKRCMNSGGTRQNKTKQSRNKARWAHDLPESAHCLELIEFSMREECIPWWHWPQESEDLVEVVCENMAKQRYSKALVNMWNISNMCKVCPVQRCAKMRKGVRIPLCRSFCTSHSTTL